MAGSREYNLYYRALVKYIVAVLLVISFTSKVFSQQRAQFTQYIANDLLINPAYAGADEALSISLLYRSQWQGVSGAPTTQLFTAHSLVKSNKVGLGLSVVNDNIGIHNILAAASSFAYRIQIKKETFLSFGLQFGFQQRKSDFNSLTGQVQNPNDPTLNNANLSETNFEFGSGIYFISPRLNLGISMPNMLNEQSAPDSVGYRLVNDNIYILGRYNIPVSHNFTIQPGLLLKYIYGLPLSADINLSGVINSVLLVGVSYRINESINPIIQARITPQLKFGYAFDYPLSTESSFGSNSHEFMLSYLFSFSKHKVSKLR